MEEKKTSFLMRDLDYDWWKKIKIEALKRDLTLKEFVLLCIQTQIEMIEKEGD